MPCNDVTERIEVVLDSDDQLVSYSLRKHTCGRAVGEQSLLRAVFIGMPIDEIVSLTPDALLERCPPASDIAAFLALKHLFAVQAACAVLSGAASGGPGEPCATARVAFEDGHTRLTGLIRVDVVHENISACGPCKGCPGRDELTRSSDALN